MQQMSLFPPPGALSQPLPEEVQKEALKLVAELLVTVLTAAGEEVSNGERNENEQDPPRAS